MRISDWSSDVCSSDLCLDFARHERKLRNGLNPPPNGHRICASKRRHQIRQMPAQRGKLVVAGDAEPHERPPLRRRDDDISPLMADAGEEVVRAAIGPYTRRTPPRPAAVPPDIAHITP